MMPPWQQFQLRALMAIVALIALDCVVIRSPITGRSLDSIMLILCSLPMANALVLGGLILLQQAGGGTHSSFLRSFEVAGLGIGGLFACLAFNQSEILREILVRTLSSCRVGPPYMLFVASAILAVPQLSLALLAAGLGSRLLHETPPGEESVRAG
jgi:hypothetical protein